MMSLAILLNRFTEKSLGGIPNNDFANFHSSGYTGKQVKRMEMVSYVLFSVECMNDSLFRFSIKVYKVSFLFIIIVFVIELKLTIVGYIKVY